MNYNRGCRKRGCFDVSSASLFNKTQQKKKERMKEKNGIWGESTLVIKIEIKSN